MSDHASGPRALADPVVDITDMYAFSSPERPGVLVLVLDVFPFAAPSALFSDAVDYRFRLRPLTLGRSGGAMFLPGEKEVSLTCRFASPVSKDPSAPVVQEGTCTASTGHTVSFRVNDARGGQAPGLRAFAGVRLDPFFLDGARVAKTIATRKLAFEPVGQAAVFRQNVLAIILELEVGAVLGDAGGPLFGVVGETVRTGPISVRFERFGRLEIKNFLLFTKDFDPVNRAIELRDLYNQEDAFRLSPVYQEAYRARINSNLRFFDGLDGKTDWPLNEQGIHPLLELLMADFMVVDVSKPFSETCYMEIERELLAGEAHQTCGGRSLNEDSVDSFLTMLVNNGKGPRISDGVDQATVPCAYTFPYLMPPEQNPPPPKPPVAQVK